ncbi:MAG: amino acid ABC transporter permease [Thermomicrobiales bacterium]
MEKTLRVIADNLDLLAAGLGVTLLISLIVIVIGTILGVLGGIGLLYGPGWLKAILRVYVDIVRGLPLLVLMFLLFYVLPEVGVEINGFQAVCAGLSLFAGAHISEIVRGAVSAVPKGQADAARSLGLTFVPMIRHIILPQAIPTAMPPWTNTAIEMVKATSLAYLLSVSDLLFRTQNVVERTGVAMPFYLTAALIYILVNIALSRFGSWLERRTRFAA